MRPPLLALCALALLRAGCAPRAPTRATSPAPTRGAPRAPSPAAPHAPSPAPSSAPSPAPPRGAPRAPSPAAPHAPSPAPSSATSPAPTRGAPRAPSPAAPHAPSPAPSSAPSPAPPRGAPRAPSPAAPHAPSPAPSSAPSPAPPRGAPRAPSPAAPRAPPRCPPLMLQLLRAPPPPLRAPAAAASALSIAPHGLLRHGSRWALSFDLSPLRGAPEPQLAELRLRLPEPWRSRNLTLELYHSPREPCGGCARRLLLATLPGASAAAEASWDVLDVTGALRAWLRPAPAPQGAPVGTAGPEPPADVAERVLLLVFSAEPSPPGACSLLRAADASKHVARAGGSAGTRRRRRNRKEKQRVKASEDAGALCRRVDMVVDFEQTGWGSWIVYPKKYNAYRCEGQCPSPVDESFKPTNHAYIQSLLGLYKPGHVPCPACSPVRTSPLSMLYYEKGELALRHHEDMVVEECGCH